MVNTNMVEHIITCPNCGKEYLPAELFIPSYFMGKIRYIERDDNNKVVSIVGENMDLHETFTCDVCNKLFHVNCEISFRTSPDVVGNFDEEYVTKL